MLKLLKVMMTLVMGLVLFFATAAGAALLWRMKLQSDVLEATAIDTDGGIDQLERIEINGSHQWIQMRGHDADAPVLLFLHGGPGSAEMAWGREQSLKIEKHFVMVHWDQRASGKSRGEGFDPDDLTIEQFQSDTVAVINYLRTRFNKDKVYLVGHSWGSVLGTLVARDNPELLHAYVGLGQVVNMVENEEVSLRFVLEAAREDGNEKALKELEGLSPPYADAPEELFVQRKWLGHYRGSFYAISLTDLVLASFAAPEYTLRDIYESIEGAIELAPLMWPELSAIDFFEQAPKLDVPVYFFTGRHDYNTPYEISQRYFEMLDAPHKEYIWFEKSGHFPNIEESMRYQNLLLEKFLGIKQEKEDDLSIIDEMVTGP